ncbi:unnamed protein product [Ectocarpus sp. 12 AP-2014]
MDRGRDDRRDNHNDGRVAAAAAAGVDTTTLPASPSRQRQQVPRSAGSSGNSSNARLQADVQSRRGSFDPMDLSGSERKRPTPSGSRLVRWAAALAGAKKPDSPPPRAASSGTKQHRRAEASSKAVEPSMHTPPIDEGGTDHDGGGGADSGDPPPAGGLSEGGLFTSSPLRHRFRTARRGLTSSGWSSSSTSSAAGWIGGGGGSGAGGDREGGASTFLRRVFKGPLTMYVIRQAKMAAALAALAVSGLGALLMGLCLYFTVRPWGRATYRRLLCSQLAGPLVDSASLLLPRTRVRVTGDSDMLDGLCPCVIVSNTLPGNAFQGLDWWTILQVARAVGAHGYTKVLVSQRLNNTPVLGWILRMLEFPGLGDCYQEDRDRVKKSLASFARDSVSAGPSGVPYMFLHFPEGGTLNRETLASSLEFAQREDRPELTHLLLPHTTALSACLGGLRQAKPVVYDFTLAADAYTGEIPPARRSPPTDWDVLRTLVAGRAWGGGDGGEKPPCAGRPNQRSDASSASGEGDSCGEPSGLCRTGGGGAAAAVPLGFGSVGSTGGTGGDAMGIGDRSQAGVGRSESGDWGDGGGTAEAAVGGGDRKDERTWGRGCQDIHVRIKRYSLEEVVGDTHWLDDRWAEKERLLAYFSRHRSFPSDGRGFPARRTLDTRGGGQFETSAAAFVRLSSVVLFVPLLSLVAIPLAVSMAGAALGYRVVCAGVRAGATRILPRRFTRGVWCSRADGEDGEEDELGQEYSGRQSTLTPWWGGPTTPLNTPAPGGAAGPGPVPPYITKNSSSSAR